MLDLRLADVAAAIKTMPDNSQDIIIADPPYNIKKDFGNNHDNLPFAEYLAWSKSYLSELYRVLKPSGILYVYGFSEILAYLSVMFPVSQTRWLIWTYKNKAVPTAKTWIRSHESILMVSKDPKQLHFNVDLVRIPYTAQFLKQAGKIRPAGTGRFGTDASVYQANQLGALARDVLEIPALAGGAGAAERLSACLDCQVLLSNKDKARHSSHKLVVHPTQKPAKLTQRLIDAYKPLNRQYNVLIPFAGSGSEVIVALKDKSANVTAFELNPDYFALINLKLKANGFLQ